MTDLYYWTMLNRYKITIFLEASGLPYRIKPVNISKGERFKSTFLAISPNNRIPAIVDDEPKGDGAPVSVFESGSILLYLAENTRQFLPHYVRRRYDAIQGLLSRKIPFGQTAAAVSV